MSDEAPPGGTPVNVASLRLYMEVVAFEARWPGHSRTKERRIGEAFRFGAARYYQLLNAAIDEREIEQHAPDLVFGLRAQRAARRAQRKL